MVKTQINEIIEIGKRHLMLFKSEDIKFERVFLFGSYNKGNPQENSDIDLTIIAPKWNPDCINALMMLTWKINTRIESHPVKTADFIESNPFAYEIMTDCVEIKIN